jgi:hypothetical protein
MEGSVSDTTLDIILWGESQVGKTTSLAAYLCDEKSSWIDHAAPETQSSVAELSPVWRTLRQNRLPSGTTLPRPYSVRLRDRRLLSFRDMKGGDAGNLAAEDLAALQRAAGLILLTTWPGERDVTNAIAVEQALRFVRDRQLPLALMVTKVEGYLKIEQLGLFLLNNPLEEARKLGALPESFLRLLALVPPQSIFFTSVYGYANGYPAQYRDEFGRLVPSSIQPKNVAAPFDHVIGGLS